MLCVYQDGYGYTYYVDNNSDYFLYYLPKGLKMLGVPDISTSRKCYTGRGEIIVIFSALLIAPIMFIILTLLPLWR